MSRSSNERRLSTPAQILPRRRDGLCRSSFPCPPILCAPTRTLQWLDRVNLAALAPLAALVALAVPATADAWTSNDFYNPGGNIQCSYIPNPGPATLICESNSNGHEVSLTPNQPAFANAGNPKGELGSRSGHLLGYGQMWHSHQFECLSTYGGVRCWTSSLSHGFFINGWEVQHW